MRTFFAVVVLAFGLHSESAIAAELFTPPLGVPPGGRFVCRIVNTSSMDRQVKIEMKDGTGAIVNQSGEFSLPATQVSLGIATIVPTGGVVNLYCRFAVKGPKTSVRGIGATTTASGDQIVLAAQ